MAARNLFLAGVRKQNRNARSAYVIPSHKQEFQGKTNHEDIWGNVGVVDLNIDTRSTEKVIFTFRPLYLWENPGTN